MISALKSILRGLDFSNPLFIVNKAGVTHVDK